MRTGRHFIYNLLGAGLPLLLAIAAVPMIGRLAGYERLGFLTIVWAAIGYLGLLDFGLSRVFARRVAVASATGQLPQEVAFLRWTARRLFALCVAAAVVVALVVPVRWLAGASASPSWLAEVRGAWVLLTTAIPPLVLSNLWRGAMEGREAFGAVNLLRVAMGAWTFGVSMVVLLFTNSLPALVGGVVVGRWLSLALHQGWCWRHLPGTAHLDVASLPERRRVLRHTLVEGAWFTVSGVVGPLMTVFDRFVLGAVAALSTAAVYAIPQEIVLRILLVPALLAASLFPRLAVLSQTNSPAGAALIERATRVTVVMQLPICLAAAWLAKPLLTLWLGPDVAVQGAPILRWMLVGCIANNAVQVSFAHLQASGRSWLTARLHLAELVPYAIGLFWAVSKYGALGAAWVWSARCAIDAGLTLVATWLLDRNTLSARLLAALAAAMVATIVAAVPDTAALHWTPDSNAFNALVCLVLTMAIAAIGLERRDARDLLSRLSPPR